MSVDPVCTRFGLLFNKSRGVSHYAYRFLFGVDPIASQ